MSKVVSFDKDGVHYVVTKGSDERFTFAKKVNTETGVGSKGRPSKFPTADVLSLFVTTGEDEVQLSLDKEDVESKLNLNPENVSSDDLESVSPYVQKSTEQTNVEADSSELQPVDAQNDGNSNGRVPSETFINLD